MTKFHSNYSSIEYNLVDKEVNRHMFRSAGQRSADFSRVVGRGVGRSVVLQVENSSP